MWYLCSRCFDHGAKLVDSKIIQAAYAVSLAFPALEPHDGLVWASHSPVCAYHWFSPVIQSCSATSRTECQGLLIHSSSPSCTLYCLVVVELKKRVAGPTLQSLTHATILRKVNLEGASHIMRAVAFSSTSPHLALIPNTSVEERLSGTYM